MKRFLQVQFVGFLGILGNLFLFGAKSVVGFVFHSQAMIADAMNSATDIFASLMTLIGGKISSVPRDEDHHYGHGKAEFLFSLFISISMMGIAIKIFYDSFKDMIGGNQLQFSWFLVLVALLTIVTKLFLFLYARKIYRDTESLLVYSNMIDHRNDMLLTTLALFSIIMSFYGMPFFDGLVGILISSWIFYSGFKIFVESYTVLMDGALSESRQQELVEFILNQKNILGITKLDSVPTGYKYMLSLSILVDGNLSTFESHEIAAKLKKKLLKKFLYIDTVSIHINPFQTHHKKRRLLFK